MKPLLLVITGPTASGKTDIAIWLAKNLKTEIVSSDSRQIYKELIIGTAQPTIEQLKEVKHHFIATHSIHQYYNASIYETEVLQTLNDLFKRYPIVVLVGGSGLYIDAVCFGIDDLPTIDPSIREHIANKLKNEGLISLQNELKQIDPEYHKTVDLNNPKRIQKAIEVFYMTKKPYSSFLTRQPKTRNFDVKFLILDLPRNILHESINNRVDNMIKNGLIEEVKNLYPYKSLNALNTVGYKELFDYFDNKINLYTAIELIKRNTRRYARRQLTWFRKYKDAIWLNANNRQEIWKIVHQIIYPYNL